MGILNLYRSKMTIGAYGQLFRPEIDLPALRRHGHVIKSPDEKPLLNFAFFIISEISGIEMHRIVGRFKSQEKVTYHNIRLILSFYISIVIFSLDFIRIEIRESVVVKIMQEFPHDQP